MRLDDGAAHRQSDPHPLTLGAIKRLETPSGPRGGKTNPGVPDTQPYPAPRVRLRSDEQLPRPVLHRAHRIGAIAQEIQNDLLELNPIALHGWQIVRELMPQNHAVA